MTDSIHKSHFCLFTVLIGICFILSCQNPQSSLPKAKDYPKNHSSLIRHQLQPPKPQHPISTFTELISFPLEQTHTLNIHLSQTQAQMGQWIEYKVILHSDVEDKDITSQVKLSSASISSQSSAPEKFDFQVLNRGSFSVQFEYEGGTF